MSHRAAAVVIIVLISTMGVSPRGNTELRTTNPKVSGLFSLSSERKSFLECFVQFSLAQFYFLSETDKPL